MVAEGKTFVDAGEAAAWYEEKVREVVDDSWVSTYSNRVCEYERHTY